MRSLYDHGLRKIAQKKDNQVTRLRRVCKAKLEGHRVRTDACIILSNWVCGIAQRLGRSAQVWHARRGRKSSRGRVTVGDVMAGIERVVSKDVYDKVCDHMSRVVKDKV